MKKLLFLFFLQHTSSILPAQNSSDSLKNAALNANADDPSQFFTRIELYNELQYYDKTESHINQTILRTIIKIGNRFTTRVDLPYVHNTFTSPMEYRQSGLGDVSFRLLGYKFFEKPKSAFTASIEVSLNTAESPILGLGKNVVIPMVSYTLKIPTKKLLLAMILQQSNSVGGDDTREDITFSKIQLIILKAWSRRAWTVLAPEWFIDYAHGGVSMNLRGRMVCAPVPRMNIWVTPSVGIFGDFFGRYKWSVDIGGRYFLFREMNFKKGHSD